MTIYFGCLIRSKSREGKPYIHMDDACQTTLEDAVSEAHAMNGYKDTEVVGIFKVDDATGKVESVYDTKQTDEAIEDYYKTNIETDEERRDNAICEAHNFRHGTTL